MKKSTDTWFIVDPNDSRCVLHKFGGVYEYFDTINPVECGVDDKIVLSKPVTYKTSRGALNFAAKVFPNEKRHSAVTLNHLKTLIFEGRIYRYRGEWDEKVN